MASTFSTNLAIELIGTGDQAGTWGTTTNSNLGTLIEQAISGYVTQAVATGTDTTITIPNGSTGVARNMYIELTGTGGASTNLIVPANKKLYFIFNNSTGAVTVKVSGQTGVSVPTGKKMVLVSNGTDIVNGLNYIADFGTNSFSVTNLTASSGTITNLIATSGSITNLVSSDASATVLRAGSATLTHLSATSATITNLTLTSLVISNLSIASANITTLTGSTQTLSGNLTLSGGTANGVLYLNGSKVATSGSALTFDGTNLGIGTASPSSRLEVLNGGDSIVTITGNTASGNFASVDFKRNTGTVNAAVRSQSVGGNDIGEMYFMTRPSAGSLTERMRLDSAGNLGLGVTPSAWSSGKAYETTAAGHALWALSNEINVTQNAYFNAGWKYGATAAAARYQQQSGEHKWHIAASGTAGNAISFTQAMTLDSSGNLGIGTASPISAIGGSVTAAGVFAASGYLSAHQTSKGILEWNANITRIRSYGATASTGVIAFNIGGGGGSADSEGMRLDASGNLGLGVTPSAWSGGGVARAIQIGNYGAGLFSNAGGDTSSSLTHGAYFDGTNWRYLATSVAATRYQMTGANAGSTHSWSVSAGGTAGNTISFTQAMTLDSGGSLGIGTTSPSSIIHAVKASGNATYLQLAQTGVESWQIGMAASSSALAFLNSGTERARITSGGNLLVGTTSAGAGVGYDVRLAVDGGAAEAGIFKTSGGSSAYSSVLWNTATTGNNLFALFGTEASITTRGSISYNRAGGLVAYNTTSDYRAKDILGPVQNSGAIIDALKVYEGQMKGASQSRPMLVAHEAQEHAPYTVTGEKDAVNEDGTPKYQQMDVSALVPLLLAELQSLRKRVAELESK